MCIRPIHFNTCVHCYCMNTCHTVLLKAFIPLHFVKVCFFPIWKITWVNEKTINNGKKIEFLLSKNNSTLLHWFIRYVGWQGKQVAHSDHSAILFPYKSETLRKFATVHHFASELLNKRLTLEEPGIVTMFLFAMLLYTASPATQQVYFYPDCLSKSSNIISYWVTHNQQHLTTSHAQ